MKLLWVVVVILVATNTFSWISAGSNNVATGMSASVAGGRFNTASGSSASVSGGSGNTASGPQAFVSGGSNNVATGTRAVVSGGSNNVATGTGAVVLGGWGIVFDNEHTNTTLYPYLTHTQWKERSNRLNDTKTLVLYHQTDSVTAAKILQDQKMLRGTVGMAGGGIYFATSAHDTYHKARAQGTVLECQVHLGRVLSVSANGNRDMGFRKLYHTGYDSVMIPRSGGTEYVVYNSDQVVSVRKK